jgi:hypothetical protein
MATGETGFDDVTSDLVSLQYHSLKPGTTTASTSATLATQTSETSRVSSNRS